MIKLLNILKETQILVPRRSSEERQKNYLIATQKKIQQYIKDGSQGDLEGCKNITSLPSGLKVKGSLDLRDTNITKLPPDLQVGDYGGLYLSNTPIQSLPDGLKVGGNLYLENTPIQSLPNGLKVGGILFLGDTPLSEKYTKEEIEAMVPGVKGDIYL